MRERRARRERIEKKKEEKNERKRAGEERREKGDGEEWRRKGERVSGTRSAHDEHTKSERQGIGTDGSSDARTAAAVADDDGRRERGTGQEQAEGESTFARAFTRESRADAGKERRMQTRTPGMHAVPGARPRRASAAGHGGESEGR